MHTSPTNHNHDADLGAGADADRRGLGRASRWPPAPSSRSHRPPRRRCRSRSPASTAAATTSPTRPGARPDRPYSRVGPARYADGIGAPVAGPNARYVSNRIFNDTNQNVFSERRVTQWGFDWGQFLDHTFGLRERHRRPTGDARRTSRSTPTDPLEDVHQHPRRHPVHPLGATPGTGRRRNAAPADQHRSSLHRRVRRLRRRPTPGWTGCATARWTATPPTTAPACCCRATTCRGETARGNAATAPAMDVDGRLLANPNNAVVAGDVRANENIAPDRDPHPVRPRAQPDRRRCCRARCRRRTSSRSPGGSSSPSSSTSPTTSSCRRWAWRCPRTPATRPTSTRP